MCITRYYYLKIYDLLIGRSRRTAAYKTVQLTLQHGPRSNTVVIKVLCPRAERIKISGRTHYYIITGLASGGFFYRHTRWGSLVNKVRDDRPRTPFPLTICI